MSRGATSNHRERETELPAEYFIHLKWWFFLSPWRLPDLAVGGWGMALEYEDPWHISQQGSVFHCHPQTFTRTYKKKVGHSAPLWDGSCIYGWSSWTHFTLHSWSLNISFPHPVPVHDSFSQPCTWQPCHTSITKLPPIPIASSFIRHCSRWHCFSAERKCTC